MSFINLHFPAIKSEFYSLQALLDPAVEEVDNIMAMNHDIDKLKTYIVAMKKYSMFTYIYICF